jgi:hypothetical protein
VLVLTAPARGAGHQARSPAKRPGLARAPLITVPRYNIKPHFVELGMAITC